MEMLLNDEQAAQAALVESEDALAASHARNARAEADLAAMEEHARRLQEVLCAVAERVGVEWGDDVAESGHRVIAAIGGCL